MEDTTTLAAKAEATAKVKSFWRSKTLWVNAIAALCLLLQAKTGYVIDPEAQAWLLTGINAALRVITKDGVSLS